MRKQHTLVLGCVGISIKGNVSAQSEISYREKYRLDTRGDGFDLGVHFHTSQNRVIDGNSNHGLIMAATSNNIQP